MAEAVTLELSDDVARHARETAQRTGRQLEDVLTTSQSEDEKAVVPQTLEHGGSLA